MSERPKIKLSAIDQSFRWTKRRRLERDEVEAGFPPHDSTGVNLWYKHQSMACFGLLYHYGWVAEHSRARAIHLTPTGLYFRITSQSWARFWSGAFLRQDGSVGGFKGRHYHPLYCQGCGRADLRVAERFKCESSFYVPEELLIRMPASPSGTMYRPPVANVPEAPPRGGGAVTRITPQSPLPDTSAVSPGPIREQALWERLLRALFSTFWSTLLSILVILAIVQECGNALIENL